MAQFIPGIYNKIILKILGYFWGVTVRKAVLSNKIDVKKEELTLRVGNEAVYFNLNHILKQLELFNDECEIVETKIPISSELINDRNFQSSMNENEMNF